MAERTTSFAQLHKPSLVDRTGRWLSTVRMRRYLGDVHGRRAADIGCGYDAALAFELFDGAASILLVDVAVEPALQSSKHDVRLGLLPDVLSDVPDSSLDAIICNNVLEHLREPAATVT